MKLLNNTRQKQIKKIIKQSGHINEKIIQWAMDNCAREICPEGYGQDIRTIIKETVIDEDLASLKIKYIAN